MTPTSPTPEAAASQGVPAATVVLLRDRDHGLETLLLRRNADLAFAGGMWVWPGGRLDDADYEGGTATDDTVGLEAAARRAAAREAREEADLDVDPAAMVWFSHWTPPPINPRRYLTWFFAAEAPEGQVRVDGGEIHDHAWMTPAEAMRRRNDREIELSPPTWITLEQLAEFTTVAEALRGLAERGPQWFATRFVPVEGGAALLYAGDAGYDDEDAVRPGPRHRLWMLEAGWRYERSDRPAS